MSTKMYMQEYTPYAVYQVLCVNLDVHKNVHAGDLGDVDRYEAAVPVMHQEVGSESSRTEVIDATRPIRDVSQNEAMLHICKANHQDKILRVGVKSSSVEAINTTHPICDVSQNEAMLHICKATIKTQCCGLELGLRAAALKSSMQHAPYVTSPRLKHCSTSAKLSPRHNFVRQQQLH